MVTTEERFIGALSVPDRADLTLFDASAAYGSKGRPVGKVEAEKQKAVSAVSRGQNFFTEVLLLSFDRFQETKGGQEESRTCLNSVRTTGAGVIPMAAFLFKKRVIRPWTKMAGRA